MDVVIYHNPACGTSRNTLALIRNAGVEPHVEAVLDLLPPQRGAFAKEDGEKVVDATGARVG
jgi:arsenate reductase